MSETLNWRINADSDDWECGWESSRRFQLRYWASLPLRAKLEAIEEMGDIAERLSARLKEPASEEQ